MNKGLCYDIVNKRLYCALAGCWADDPEDAARMEAAIKDGRKNEYMLDVNFDD